MNSNQILTITVIVIVITIVGTITLAVVGYLAFRLRERKQPTRPGLDQVMSRPYFFERVQIPEPGQDDSGALAALPVDDTTPATRDTGLAT